ncbi:MAG: glycine cleavage system protein R [Brevinematia bacterium]
MKRLSLICMGKDKPGIVAKVSEVLFKSGGSIEGSRMSLIQGEFAIILIFTLFDDSKMHFLRRELKRVEYEMDIDVNVRELDEYEYSNAQVDIEKTYIIDVYGADKPGIVFNVSNVLFMNGINIIDLFTDVVRRKDKDIYVMSITVDGNNIPSVEFLREKVEKVCKEMGLEISIHEVDKLEM